MTRIDQSLAWPSVRVVTVGSSVGALHPIRFPTFFMVLDLVRTAGRRVGALMLSVLLYGLLSLAVFGPVLSMALDRRWRLLAMATLAPLLLVPVILGGVLVWNLVSILGELRDLARDRTARLIHGLEHATAKVLAQRGFEPEGGVTRQGFFRLNFSAYRSPVFDEAGTIHDAVIEAITRVKNGETNLAFHPRCGTSLLVAITLMSVMAIVSTAVALFFTVEARLLVLGLAGFSLLMALGAGRLGILVQKLLTVSTQFRSVGLLHVIRHMTDDGNTVYYDVLLDVSL